MPVKQPQTTRKQKPWRALYQGKWYDVLNVEDQGGNGNENKYLLKGGPAHPVKVETYNPFGEDKALGKTSKEQIVAILEKRYAGRAREALECVAADVYYSGEPAAVLASESVIDKLFDSYNSRRAAVDAKKGASVDSNEFCPICKMATAGIKLADDRPAKWCPRHFVVFPIKAKEERE